MAVSDMLQLAGQFGPMGLLVAYLIWRERSSEGKRMAYDQARLAKGAPSARAGESLCRNRGNMTGAAAAIRRG
jgi:hypothetical protein